ncbi:ATP-grasp domain-containing protein [Streptomyces sp. PBH53]|uniref:ATP-grasp domain-containing protein n=1 Tax=Streptomyces sp. PBH53 TaxID=1577075 RepID=UPI001AD83993|nr:ATP-grasp domain-containing protein [Streptomyces sp. PBH53]
MSLRRVLVLEGSARFLAKSAGLGLQIINLRSTDDLPVQVRELCREVQVVDFYSLDRISDTVLALHSQAPFSAIICQAESLQTVAGYLNDLLGLPGTSLATARLVSDKFALREQLRARRLSSAASAIAHSAEQLEIFTRENGPAIAKPRSGSGSWGVMRLERASDAASAWQWALKAGMTELLVETLLVGPEISLEFFSVAGQHIPLAATTKEVNERFVEVGHAVPAALTKRQFEQCQELVAAVLDTVGIQWGPSHTEVILTADGPEVVETHCRRAGGHINELVRLVYGVDMEELVFRHAAGQEIPLSGQPEANGAAAVRWLGAETGVVTSVYGVDEVADDSYVSEVSVLAPGTRSHGLRWAGDYLGHLIALGATPEEAMARASSLERKIRFVVEPEPLVSGCNARGVTREATDLLSLLNP